MTNKYYKTGDILLEKYFNEHYVVVKMEGMWITCHSIFTNTCDIETFVTLNELANRTCKLIKYDI